jgi:DNA invertase Pin-like site-specific DNA recombinase
MDTTTSGGRLIFHMFAALAEFERNLIRERTIAGLTAARARGHKGGRPRKLTQAQIEMALSLYDGRQHTIKEICALVGISKPTLYRYIRARTPETPLP